MSSRAWLARSFRTRAGLMQWAMLLAAIGFVVWIVVTRGDDLRAAFELTPRLFALISLSCFATFALNGIELQVLAGRFGSRIPLKEGLMLGLMVSTLNYLPMKTGTVLNGVVIKARYKLSLSHFTALVAGSSVIHLWVGLVMAGVSLLLGPAEYHNWGWLFVFGPSALIAGLMVWGRLRESGRLETHDSKIVRAAARAVDGVGDIFSDLRLLVIEIVINVALITLWAARSYWSFEALGVEASFGSVLTVTALGILFTRLSIIPGGVGFREAGAAFGSRITGLPSGAGFAASVVERAVMLVWLLGVGVPATLYMLRLSGVGLDDAVRSMPSSETEGGDDGAQ